MHVVINMSVNGGKQSGHRTNPGCISQTHTISVARVQRGHMWAESYAEHRSTDAVNPGALCLVRSLGLRPFRPFDDDSGNKRKAPGIPPDPPIPRVWKVGDRSGARVAGLWRRNRPSAHMPFEVHKK